MISRKKKGTILLVVQLPPPVHGVSLMNSYIIESEIINRNYNIDVINLQFSAALTELGKFSVKKLLITLSIFIQIFGRVLLKKPELVYFTLAPTGFAFYRDALYVFLLKLLRCEIIIHLHGKGIHQEAARNRLLKQLYISVFKDTRVICLTETLTGDIGDVYNSKPFIVPNGIREDSRTEISIEKRQGKHPVQLLYLSNLIESKGILILIDALKILKEQSLDFSLRVVGAPGDITLSYLNDYIIQRGLEKDVIVVGPLYGDNKLIEFQKADIFVFPTYNDVFGLVNLEAMQFALPIVSTIEGGIPSVVLDTKTGFLVEPRNSIQLAEKLEILLRDENLRLKMGLEGRRRFCSNFTLMHFESNLLNVFETVMKQRSGR